MKRHRTWGFAVLLAGGLFVPLFSNPAVAQTPRSGVVNVRDNPYVSVWYEGEFGPMRLFGTMTKTPAGLARIKDRAGNVKDVPWTEIRSIDQVTSFPRDENPEPARPMVVGLVGDAEGRSAAFGRGSAAPQWTLVNLPDGAIEVRGEPYGVVQVPAKKVTGFDLAGLSGPITLPDGNVELQIAADRTISIPLRHVRQFVREENDRVRVETAGQIFSGKLVKLPDGSVEVQLRDERTVQVPLSRVRSISTGTPAFSRGTPRERGE